MDKSCKQCGATVKRAGLCADCRTARRRDQWVRNTQTYRDRGRRPAVSLTGDINQFKAEHDTNVSLVTYLPIPSRNTPRGPDEGCTTTNPELQAILDQKAAEAANHPWWEENPGVFTDL
jgi:hypothetical protein